MIGRGVIYKEREYQVGTIWEGITYGMRGIFGETHPGRPIPVFYRHHQLSTVCDRRDSVD